MEASYQQFADADDSEDTPQGSGIMIHFVPESGKAARWNHIEDLDSFFSKVYQYHQKHGFRVMAVHEFFGLFQFVFVVIFSAYLFYCVDYEILFKNKPPPNKNEKVSLSDALLGCHECVQTFDTKIWCIIIIASIFWLLRAVKVFYHLFQFYDVKAFYNVALKINDGDLDNVTWHEVQKRVREVQLEQQMCIHKKDLTQLDIYHRILRFKNYLVAMVNKNLLPVKLNIPVIGETVYLTHGLKYNIEFLLFWGPWSPFENNWHLKEEYKKVNRRHDLAQMLSKMITYVAMANLLLCPLILLWQILYSFFSYAEIIKREPGVLGARCWSLYGKIYLRHFNELDHELYARLNRAYRPASKYMNSFTDPFMTEVARNFIFVGGSIAAVLIILTLYDEDVINVEYVLTILSLLIMALTILRGFIPDENMVWCPEVLMTQVLSQVHYIPDSWRGKAHTSKVRQEFAQLFQFKAIYLVSELLSPIVTPLMLLFYIRPKALDIVDFYRNFTVEVVGVGDVCSFAQMDVRRHGNPMWQSTPALATVAPQPAAPPNQYTQAEDGKTELSLLHFTMMNPDWQPPADARDFMAGIRSRAGPPSTNSAFGVAMSGLSPRPGMPGTSQIPPLFSDSENDDVTPSMIRTGLTRAEGPLPFGLGLYVTNQQQPMMDYSLGASVFGPDSVLPEGVSLTHDMNNSTLYLHDLHQRHVRRRGPQQREMNVWQRHSTQPTSVVSSTVAGAGAGAGTAGGGGERTPLLLTAPNTYYNPS
ncbi:autophagy-related protein 9A isoform X1 [Nilaparvata lugens]|uniref:autophagy-related protein 9A isoform X1 n=1 Tax=Nilaparvata lugens TaxID=108931 RepID=UPI000B98EB33|nr:autophagy-related protein 9A isoform X1 [Nilaparvata lugens]